MHCLSSFQNTFCNLIQVKIFLTFSLILNIINNAIVAGIGIVIVGIYCCYCLVVIIGYVSSPGEV